MTNALENACEAEGLLVRAEPPEWAEELSRRMVRVERTAAERSSLRPTRRGPDRSTWCWFLRA
jgi:hypothetical protein